LYYGDEILGVLSGIITENQMLSILHNTFFDESSRTYLCTKDGNIISSGKAGHEALSVFDEDAFNKYLGADVEAELKKAIDSGEDYEFQYDGTAGKGNAYVTHISSPDWIFVQTFPSQVTSKFIRDANTAGLILLTELVAIFVICIIILYISSTVQKKRLIKENEEMSYVVDGIVELFKVFILLDLKNETYRYLLDTKPWKDDIPLQGDYDLLFNFVLNNTVDDSEERAHLADMLSIENLRKSMNSVNSHVRYEYRIVDEVQRWDSLNVICIKYENDEVTQALLTRQDVTRAKTKELENYDALKSAYKALENANQAKTRFLNNVSHDIRTPMNAIIGFTALAGTHIDKKELVKDYLSKIMTSSNHLLSLINDVLDMSRIESGKVKIEEKECNLPEIMHDLKNILQADIHSKRLEFLIDTVDVVNEDIICDKLRLNQILLNCLSNAMKFTKPGGTVSVRIIQKQDAPVGYASYEFRVRDTGIGMSKDFIKHIFEPFERERTSTVSGIQGTGLGMAITKNIVDMMHGTITVESEEGHGSEFTIALKFKISENAKRVDETVYALKGLRALVADDDFNTCTSVSKMLTTIGLRADWTTSGKEAVLRASFAKESNDEFRVYIIDLLMPDMNGIECVRRIRMEIGDDTPIIILTAYDWSDLEKEAREAGVTAFCSKPIFLSELKEVLISAGGHKKEEEIVPQKVRNFNGKSILLAEDVELNREIAEEVLREVGFKVTSALNGKEAVDMINRAGEDEFDLVLMDIQMPIMNGYDAAKEIRNLDNPKKANIPIIAMTADAFEEDKKKAYEAGMNGHLSKPINVEELYDMIENNIK
jgi:signal transduction histidine kinase/DNA-binding response OmpR family regulator